MVWVGAGCVLLWYAWGPVVPLVVAALLAVPRIRHWVRARLRAPRWFSARVGAISAGALALLVAVAIVLPDGWLPIPPSPGVWAAPSYVGRPTTTTPLGPSTLAPNPHLVSDGAAERGGPLGWQPEVATGWYGLDRCRRLALTGDEAILGVCQGRSGSATLRLIDPDTLRARTSIDLPATPERSDCTEPSLLLASPSAAADPSADPSAAGAPLAILAAGDRQILGVAAEAERLRPRESWDLKPYVPYRDCITSLALGWSGRIWWASREGLVGTLDPASGAVGVLDLGEPIRRGLATDAGGAYVVTDKAVHHLRAGAGGAPTSAWRAPTAHPGGSAPVLLPSGVVATTDEVGDRLAVVFSSRADGRRLCRTPVFEAGASTSTDLVSVGAGVIVTNSAGYSSPRSTLFGFSGEPGIARVDLAGESCAVTWTNEASLPSARVLVSRPDGLVYAWTKRPSRLGVSAWYLSAIDAGTGRTWWAVRTGTGVLAGTDGGDLLLGPDQGLYAGVLGGIVRVHDR